MSQPIMQLPNRPADAAIQRSEVKLTGMALISRAQVKLWKAMLVSVFFAGLVGALAFIAGFTYDPETGDVKVDAEYEAIEAALPKSPDLVIQSVKTAKSQYNFGEPIVFEATVSNQGSGIMSTGFLVRFCMEYADYYPGSPYGRYTIDGGTCMYQNFQYFVRAYTESESEGIQPGQSTVVKARQWIPSQPGGYSVVVCADAIKEVSETDENNNCTTFGSVKVKVVRSSGPDLVVPTAPSVEQKLVNGKILGLFSSQVRNRGNGAAGIFENHFQFDYNVQGSFVSDTQIGVGYDIERLSAGASAPIRTRETDELFLRLGTHAVRLCADVSRLVPESNEYNNCGPETVFTVSNLVPPPSPLLPDLTVENFKAPDFFTPNKPVAMSGIVCNRGKVATPKGGNVAFMDDGKVACQQGFPILKPNTCSAEFKCTGVPTTADPEYYAAMFIFNPGFQEVSESNNSVEKWLERVPVPLPINSNTPRPEP